MLQQFLVTINTLAAIALVAIATVMLVRYHKAWKKRQFGRAHFLSMLPHQREHVIVDMLGTKLCELWDLPREDRPVVAIIVKAPKGDGVMMFGHPEGITPADNDYSQGKCRDVLQAIATNMGRVESHLHNKNCVDTLLGMLEREQVKLQDERNEKEQLKSLLQ